MGSSSNPAAGSFNAAQDCHIVQQSVPANSSISRAQQPTTPSPQQQHVQQQLQSKEQELVAAKHQAQRLVAAGPRHPIKQLYTGLFLTATVLLCLEAYLPRTYCFLHWLVSVGKLVALQLGILEHVGAIAYCAWVARVYGLFAMRDWQLYRVLQSQGLDWTPSQAMKAALTAIFAWPDMLSWLLWLTCTALTVREKLGYTEFGFLPQVLQKRKGPSLFSAYYCVAFCSMFNTKEKLEYCTVTVGGCLLIVPYITAVALCKVAKLTWTYLPWLLAAFLWLVLECWQGVKLTCTACFVEAVRTVLWLRASTPLAVQAVRHAWVQVCKVLWVLVAADMVSLPWQHVVLDRCDKGLALLLPAVQIVAGHMLLMFNRRLPTGAAKRAVQAWVDKVSEVQHGLAALLAVNWLWLAAAAILSLSDSIFHAEAVQGGAPHLGSVRTHLAAHFVLTGTYAVLSAAVAVVVSSKAAQTRLHSSAAFLRWLPCAVGSHLRSAGISCRHAVCTAVRVAIGRPYAALVCCQRWLMSGCSRCTSVGTGLVVRAPVQLLARMLAGLRGVRPACCKSVGAVLTHASAAPTAALRAWACAAQAALAAAAAAVHWCQAAEGVQHGAVDEDAPQQTAEAEAVDSAAQTVSTEVPLVEVPDVATRTAAPTKKPAKKLRASCMVHDCVVCLDAPRSVALFPCRHVALCDHCFADLQRQAQRVSAGSLPCCPLCRTEVQHYESGLILA